MIQSHTEQASTVSSQEATESASPKMDPALKAKWVEALRSGKYGQGRGGLRIENRFCCLGVLCDVSDLGEWRERETEEGAPNGFEFEFRLPELASDADLLPTVVRDYLGIAAAQQARLWKMNDGSGLTPVTPFPKIADYIEENL